MYLVSLQGHNDTSSWVMNMRGKLETLQLIRLELKLYPIYCRYLQP